MYHKKGQVWYLDLFLAFSIVLFVGLLYVQYVEKPDNTQSRLATKAQTISGLLMSPGYPLDWNTSTVSIPGIVEDYTINQAKLDELYLLSHNELTAYFSTDRNIVIQIFQDGAPIQASGVNYTGKMFTNTSQQIASVQRMALYNTKPAILRVVVWE